LVAQVRIAYVGGSDAEHAAFESIVNDDGTTVVRFLLPAEAIATLLARTTDVLFIDVMQASGDVLALLKTVHKEHGPSGRIPVIVIAPPDAASRVQACLQRGADDYVILPFDQSNPLLIRMPHTITRRRNRKTRRCCRSSTASRPGSTRPGRTRKPFTGSSRANSSICSSASRWPTSNSAITCSAR
jgi:DNA-binding NtrC family response regulator